MKTQKLKCEIRYDTVEKRYVKSAMYEFDFSTDILVVEIMIIKRLISYYYSMNWQMGIRHTLVKNIYLPG